MATSTTRTKKIIGRQVAAQRDRMGLSVPKMAKKLSIDRTYLWRIERGEALPSLTLLDRMAATFGVTLDEMRRA